MKFIMKKGMSEISAQNMNEELRQLYERNVGSLLLLINKDKKLSDPLLLSVDERYLSARTKIMIVGQETHKWEWHKNDEEKDPGYPITMPLSEYVSILMARYQRKHWGKVFKASSFWKAADQIYENLNDYPGRPDIGYLWNNIDKVDCNGGPLSEMTRKNVWDCFFVLKEELKIIKPDIVIFFIGQRYDALLKEKGCKVIPLPEKMQIDFEWLAKIEWDGVLPYNSYILAHPNRLRRAKKIEYIDTVVDLIKQAKAQFENSTL